MEAELEENQEKDGYTALHSPVKLTTQLSLRPFNMHYSAIVFYEASLHK
jgi:hypothetical protein